VQHVLKRISRSIIFIDEKGKSILNFLIDKPMTSRKEVYFEKHSKEMTKRQYEEERFFLMGFYWIMLLVVVFAVRGLFS